jgi:hypothetical protein
MKLVNMTLKYRIGAVTLTQLEKKYINKIELNMAQLKRKLVNNVLPN